jgi:hypothetical protein
VTTGPGRGYGTTTIGPDSNGGASLPHETDGRLPGMTVAEA